MSILALPIAVVLRKGQRTLVLELKSSTAPKVSTGFWHTLDDISPAAACVVASVKESFPIKGGVTVVPLGDVFLGMS